MYIETWYNGGLSKMGYPFYNHYRTVPGEIHVHAILKDTDFPS